MTPLILFAVPFALLCLDHDPLHAARCSNDATAGRLYTARHEIADYYAANGHLPRDLRQFLRACTHSLDNDSVGRPLHVAVSSDGVTVEIAALGEDGRPGGRGANRDIVGIFRADIPAGEKIEDVGPWIRDPLDDVKPWKL